MITIRGRNGELHRYVLERDAFDVLWVADFLTRWQLLLALHRLGCQVIDAEPEDCKLLEECGVWGGRVQ